MSFRVCFLQACCTSEEIVHAQERQTYWTHQSLFWRSVFLLFLFLPLHSAIDKIHFNIAERIAVTKSSLFPGCIKALTANPTTLAMLPCWAGFVHGSWWDLAEERLRPWKSQRSKSSKEEKGTGDKKASNLSLKGKENLIKMCWLTQNTWAWTSKGS